jgi:hypothetical protein
MDWLVEIDPEARWILTIAVFALVACAWTQATLWLGWVSNK